MLAFALAVTAGLATALVTALATAHGAHAQSTAARTAAPRPGAALPLKLVQTIPLPGYSGDFDHFAVDTDRGRLLLAAEDHGTLEVFDLKTFKHLQTVKGNIATPHSILVRPGAKTIIVTDSDKMSHYMDADTYADKGSIQLVPGADSASYDAAANVYYIVTGGKDVKMDTCELAAINPDTGAKLGAISFKDNHVEAMTLEKDGDRLFINLAQTNQLAVVNRKTMKLIAMWPVPPARQNAMVNFDAASHRLFVVARDPGRVIVMNADTGAVTAALPAPMRTDETILDNTAHRLYVLGGQDYSGGPHGTTGIYDVSDPDHIKQIAKVPTALGAKTGTLLPGGGKLVMAASPGESKSLARVLVFDVKP